MSVASVEGSASAVFCGMEDDAEGRGSSPLFACSILFTNNTVGTVSSTARIAAAIRTTGRMILLLGSALISGEIVTLSVSELVEAVGCVVAELGKAVVCVLSASVAGTEINGGATAESSPFNASRNSSALL